MRDRVVDHAVGLAQSHWRAVAIVGPSHRVETSTRRISDYALTGGFAMQVRNSFPLPEDPPAVPEQLLDKVHDAIRGGLAEIDIMRAQGSGWMVVNNITLEEKDSPTQVAEMIVRCGDRDANTRATSCKYRAQLWLGDGKDRNATRQYCTFSVLVEGDEPDSKENRVGGEWAQIFHQQSAFIDKLTDYSLQLVEQNVERAKDDHELARDVHQVVRDVPYREGLELKNQAVVTVLKERFRADQEVSKARAVLERESEEDVFWKHMSPMFSAAFSQVASKLGMDIPALPAAPSAKAPKNAIKVKQHKGTEGRKAPEGSRPLHAQGRALLDGLDAITFMSLMDVLTPEQRESVKTIAASKDDDTAGHAMLTLMDSLMRDMGALMKLNSILGSERVTALRQLAAAAKAARAEG
jgi:hypothetical protein